MKKLVLFLTAAVVASAAFAQQAETAAPAPKPVKLDPKLEALIKQSLPVCPDLQLTFAAMEHKLPANLSGTIVQMKSSRNSCDGQLLNVVSQEGDFYLGLPWFLDAQKDQPTLEAKLKAFTWNAFQDTFTPQIDKTKTRYGLYRVTLLQTTERGQLPLEGEIDPAGTVFFLGHFHPMDQDTSRARLAAFAPFLADSPATGAAKPAVTVIEFSDFECPSCQHASGYMKPILDQFGDKVRYVRYDLPLIANHPWALAAAIGGRAIYNQKPELFWEYKKQVYANQEKLSAFTIDDFARGFAQDHELDLKKYDADVASSELKAHLIKGVGVAFSNDIRATPTYLVNGVMVDAGQDGKSLQDYVASLVKK